MKHKDLIDQLTLEEKAALLGGKGEWDSRDIPRLGIPSMIMSDGPHGLRRQAGAGDHLGLNASLPATCFPTAATMANSWDRDLGTFARTGHEHKEKPAVRTKFRVFLRRPVSGGQNGSILCKGNPEPGGILLHQALRGQLSGGTPHGDERGRRRANPPGDLPDRI